VTGGVSRKVDPAPFSQYQGENGWRGGVAGGGVWAHFLGFKRKKVVLCQPGTQRERCKRRWKLQLKTKRTGDVLPTERKKN